MANNLFDQIDHLYTEVLSQYLQGETFDKTVVQEIQRLRELSQAISNKIPELQSDVTEEENDSYNVANRVENEKVRNLFHAIETEGFFSSNGDLTENESYIKLKKLLSDVTDHKVDEIKRALFTWNYEQNDLEEYHKENPNYQPPTTEEISRVFDWLKFEEIKSIIYQMLKNNQRIALVRLSAIASWGTDNNGRETLESLINDHVILCKRDDVDLYSGELKKDESTE
jgi:hypothetical protein